MLAHRVSWQIANGRPPTKGLVIRHSCDNRKCVNPAHLIEGTHAENMQDAIERGRFSLGDRHYMKNSERAEEMKGEGNLMALLTEDQVRAIRSEYSFRKVTSIMLGEKYGVSRQTVMDVVNGRRWGWLK